MSRRHARIPVSVAAEREAAKLAASVARAPAPYLSGASTSSDRAGTAAPATARSAVAGAGQFLPDEVRARFEPLFGVDLGAVRIHADADGAHAASVHRARAITSGHHIAFGHRQYEPGTGDGRRLLAHELTHVMQQTGAGADGVTQHTAGPTVQADEYDEPPPMDLQMAQQLAIQGMLADENRRRQRKDMMTLPKVPHRRRAPTAAELANKTPIGTALDDTAAFLGKGADKLARELGKVPDAMGIASQAEVREALKGDAIKAGLKAGAEVGIKGAGTAAAGMDPVGRGDVMGSRLGAVEQFPMLPISITRDFVPAPEIPASRPYLKIVQGLHKPFYRPSETLDVTVNAPLIRPEMSFTILRGKKWVEVGRFTIRPERQQLKLRPPVDDGLYRLNLLDEGSVVRSTSFRIKAMQ